MRLIDAKKLEDSIWALRSQYQMMDDGQAASKSLAVLRQIERMVENAETVDADPVAHARWVEIERREGRKMVRWNRCTHCFWLRRGKTPYCPNCGAHMEVEHE